MRRSALVVLVALSACTAARTSPDTRYLGMILNARDIGASELDRLAATDPALATELRTVGRPDFLIEPSTDDVELIYYERSLLVHFHRDDAGTVTTSELSPLPEGLIALLPRDIRAGTATPDGGPACWTTEFSVRSCRTCCASQLACVVSCQPRAR